jgi:hypothetical protein
MAMDPKRKPGLLVAIGVQKPKGPPPSWGDGDAQPGPEAQGPDDGDQDQDDPASTTGDSGQQKVDPQAAHVYTGDMSCVTCEHYIHPTHECQKVSGNNFGIEVKGCVDFYEPEGSSDDMNQSGASGGLAPAPAPQGEQYGGSNTSSSGY